MYSTVKKPHREIFKSSSLAGVKGRLILLVNAVFMATKLAGDVYDYRVREFERFW